MLDKGSISKSVNRREGRQEAYLAIGEFVAWEETHGLHSGTLAEALKGPRRGRAGGREGVATETHRGPSGAYETTGAPGSVTLVPSRKALRIAPGGDLKVRALGWTAQLTNGEVVAGRE